MVGRRSSITCCCSTATVPLLVYLVYQCPCVYHVGGCHWCHLSCHLKICHFCRSLGLCTSTWDLHFSIPGENGVLCKPTNSLVWESQLCHFFNLKFHKKSLINLQKDCKMTHNFNCLDIGVVSHNWFIEKIKSNLGQGMNCWKKHIGQEIRQEINK